MAAFGTTIVCLLLGFGAIGLGKASYEDGMRFFGIVVSIAGIYLLLVGGHLGWIFFFEGRDINEDILLRILRAPFLPTDMVDQITPAPTVPSINDYGRCLDPYVRSGGFCH